MDKIIKKSEIKNHLENAGQLPVQPEWYNSYLQHKPNIAPSTQFHSKASIDPLEHLRLSLLNRGWLMYHPKKGFIRNERMVNRGDNQPLMKMQEGPVKLLHYGKIPGLKVLDPEFQGTGAPSSENKYGLPEVKRTYYYRHGTPEEDIVKQGAKSKYKSTLAPEHKLYDLASDSEGHVKNAVEENQGAWNSDLILGKVKDAGYHGFYNSNSSLPNVVALFHPHPVESEEVL